MRGHIRKREWTRKDGRVTKSYYAVVFLGTDPASGKKRYDWGSGYKTKRDAEDALTEKLSTLAQGTFVRSASLTFGEYLTDWLPSIRSRTKPTTFATYRSVTERYIIPMLGTRRLQDLTTLDLSSLYGRLAAGELPSQTKHPKRENKPLSAKSVDNIARIVSKALNDALDHGLVSRNVALRAKRPRPQKPEIQAWTAAELRTFLDLTNDHRLGPLWALLAATGLRRGEALGLRWEDVSFGSKRISVRQTLISNEGKIAVSTPKTHQSRTVDLDDGTAAMLRRHRSGQKKERLAYGEGYKATDLVFRKEDGSPLHPDVVSTAFSRAVKASKLRRIRLHDLRHTHATLMLMAEIPAKIVSERLGHSSPAFTMSVYQHVLPGMQADAAARFAAILREAETGQSDSDEDLG